MRRSFLLFATLMLVLSYALESKRGFEEKNLKEEKSDVSEERVDEGISTSHRGAEEMQHMLRRQEYNEGRHGMEKFTSKAAIDNRLIISLSF